MSIHVFRIIYFRFLGRDVESGFDTFLDLGEASGRFSWGQFYWEGLSSFPFLGFFLLGLSWVWAYFFGHYNFSSLFPLGFLKGKVTVDLLFLEDFHEGSSLMPVFFFILWAFYFSSSYNYIF